MKLIASIAVTLNLFFSLHAVSMEIEVREDLLSELQDLVFIYPPASPANHDGKKRSPMPPDFGAPQSGPSVITLTGQITKGDADKFIQYHKNNWAYNQLIVLDSPGGNFLAALRIGSHLQELQDPSGGGDYPTFYFLVRKGDKCLSACALILAMGGGVGNALVEQGAEVGFHMGILPKGQAEQSARIGDVMNLTYDIVSEYTRLIVGGWQPPELLREALKHRKADSFYYLRGGMRSWQMGFEPVARSSAAPQINQVGLDDGTVMRACSALMYSSSPRLPDETRHFIAGYGDFTPRLPDAAVRMQEVFDDLGSDHIARPFPDETFHIVTCSLSRDRRGNVFIGIYDRNLDPNGSSSPTCATSRRSLSWCATKSKRVHPFRAPLLGNSLGCNNGSLLKVGPDNRDNWIGGWSETERERNGKAKRDVNIRKTPGLETPPIGTLKKGSEVQIVDCTMTNDKQGVFFKVRSIQNNGWVSARFIIEDGLFAFPITN